MKKLLLKVFVVLGVLHISKGEPVCRNIQIEGDDQQHCIQVTETPAAWNADVCPGEYSLLEIDDQAELTFVESQLSGLGIDNDDQLWIGARLQPLVGWRWVNQDAPKTGTLTWANVGADETHFVARITETGGNDYEFYQEVRTQEHNILCEIANDVAVQDETFRLTVDTNRHYVGFTGTGNSVSWEVARRRCAAITETNAWLATVDNDDLLAVLSADPDMPENENFWIGLRRAQWEWQEGRVMDEEYPWALNQPMTGCAFMTYEAAGSNTAWSSDADCDATRVSLCEITQDAPDPDPGNGGGNGVGRIHLNVYTCILFLVVVFLK